MTQQFGHSDTCRSSFERMSASVFSSRYSESSSRNSLHVSKGVVSFALEETRKFVAKLQAGAQQAALDRGHREIERLGGLFGRKTIHIAKREDSAVDRREAIHGFGENGVQFRLRETNFRVGIPRRDFADHCILAGIDLFVERNRPVALALAQLHQRLIDGDANDPRVKL